MNERHTFRARIQQADGGGAFVSVPLDVETVFGRKRVPVQATIEGQPYRGTLTRMGGPDHMLIVVKEIRERIGRGAGDEVEVTLWEDREPRTVELPADLRAALDEDGPARAFFDSLSYTHRKEYARWIAEAKRESTRRARLARALEMLRQGKKPR